eukprot:m.61868 g.61868  ORF g.61868 m.61868 type:complete len:188 (+) comp17622_c0_seq1:394-957(+)
MPPKKGKRGTGSKDPSPVKKGSKVLTVQDPAQETDDTTSPPPKSINKKPSLLGRLRGKDKSGKSPATSPLPNRKKTRGSKKNEDGGRDSNDILIADAAVFEAQLPDFDKLPMTEGELDEATKHNMDGSSPEIIADFIAMATAEDGPDTVSAVRAQPRSLAPCWPNTVPCTHHHQQWLLGRDTTPCHP